MSFWDSLVDRLQTFGEAVIEWAVLILVALIVLVIGRWIIGLIRTWTEKLLEARWLQPLWDRSGVSTALQGTDPETTGTSSELMLKILYPPINLFHRFLHNQRAEFNDALAEALELNKEYWDTPEEGRNYLPTGSLPLGPLARTSLLAGLAPLLAPSVGGRRGVCDER